MIKTQKANVLTSAVDLVYILNWDIQNKVKPVQKQLLDLIAVQCDFPIYRISGMLLNMELKGVIGSLPRKLFEAI